ncbi:MAG: HAMP domain-containing protein [Myxococcaceae bacterium]|nr:HAMP domain-containing protein [Myxococcaceae bacterium]
MSIRTRILLFVGVALGLVAAMGGVLFQSASRARELRARISALDQQLGLFAGMQSRAWTYLGRMLQAGRLGTETRELLREHEQLLHEDLEKLQEGLRTEQQWQELPGDVNEPQLLQALYEARRQWAEGAEVVLRPATVSSSPAPSGWWELFATYEQEVGPHLDKAMGAKIEKQRKLQALLDEHLHRAQQAGGLAPVAAGLLLGLLAVLLLLPVPRELAELRAGTDRIRGGDLKAELPASREDELGALAQAINRLAQELRESLAEKERMRQAEAETAEHERRRDVETAERDLLRYNAALEQVVRARTLELESANSQLANSLHQLQTMQAQLMFADRLAAMGRLAAGVGHEINNPLTYVITNLHYLQSELHDTQATSMSEEDRRELLTALSEAKEGAERVRVIVQDLKMLSRPDDASTGQVDLKEVLRAAVKIAAHEIRRRARLVEELGEVPRVPGSASRLGQVFLNLLINAAQAIPEGRAEQHEVRVAARQEPTGLVLVEVRDTGCGIPRENLERIFDPFFTTKPVGEGTGLGLALVHSIITALGGSIAVESELNQGTTFRVTLPSARPAN